MKTILRRISAQNTTYLHVMQPDRTLLPPYRNRIILEPIFLFSYTVNKTITRRGVGKHRRAVVVDNTHLLGLKTPIIVVSSRNVDIKTSPPLFI